MGKKTTDLRATSVTSFLQAVFHLPEVKSGLRCYRGHANISWKLKPSVMRDLKPEAESQIFSELILESPNEFATERLMFNKLVIARHYGLPTRLLDVTLNPLVGLYFACDKKDKEDGVVFVIDFDHKRIKFADSDVVSLVCNLTRLSDKERQSILECFKATDKWTNSAKVQFRKLPAMLRLSQFIRVEKSYFLDIAEPLHLSKYFFVYPEKSNKRLIAQSGAFIAAGLLSYDGLDKSHAIQIRKILISPNYKESIKNELDAININSRVLYPDIESAAKYIKRKWTRLA